MAEPSFATVRLKIVTRVRKYQPFEGSNAAQMYRLLTGRDPKTGRRIDVTRLPISPKTLAIARLGRIKSQDDTDYLGSRYVDTSTAVLPNPSGGEVKFENEHSVIYQLNPETRLVGSNLPLTQKDYNASNGFELTREQATTLRSDPYALPNLRRRIWEERFFEGDVSLTADYIAYVKRSTGMKFDQIMGLYLPSNKGLRLLGVDSVVGVVRSGASGNDVLDYCDGLLVGVAAESQLVAQKMRINLEELLRD